MYSNNRGFSLVDILLKVIFFVIFVLVLVLLFPQVKDLNPFYSGIFRENISYMQDAAEGYFNQTENLPTEIGSIKKLTLKQMIEKNLIVPFVDKDNNSCNLYSSYAEIEKLEDGYKLKISLVCNDESNYIEKYIGCNNYCDGVNCKNCTDCDKKISIETPDENRCYDYKSVTYYQFKKSQTVFSTSYYCEEGYSLKEKKCYREKTDNRIVATPVYDPDTTQVTNATVIPGETYKEYTDSIVTYETVNTPVVTQQLLPTVQTPVTGGTYQEPYSCPQTSYQQQSYSCLKTGTTQQCSTTYKQESYRCNCVSVYKNGSYQEVCSTCTRTVPVQTCNNVPTSYWGTCYRTVPVTINGICYRTVTNPGTTVYSCPAGTDSTVGSGANLKCYKNVTTYKPEKVKKYSCPTNVDGSEGSGANLKCYYLKTKPNTYKCSDPSAILNGTKCYKTVPGGFNGYTCPTDKKYTLDGNYCYYTTTEEKDALFKTSSNTEWMYEWSASPTMLGWERTGAVNNVSTKVEVPCK